MIWYLKLFRNARHQNENVIPVESTGQHHKARQRGFQDVCFWQEGWHGLD